MNKRFCCEDVSRIENYEAALNIINNKEHIVMDQIHFKFVEGEWVEED